LCITSLCNFYINILSRDIDTPMYFFSWQKIWVIVSLASKTISGNKNFSIKKLGSGVKRNRVDRMTASKITYTHVYLHIFFFLGGGGSLLIFSFYTILVLKWSSIYNKQLIQIVSEASIRKIVLISVVFLQAVYSNLQEQIDKLHDSYKNQAYTNFQLLHKSGKLYRWQTNRTSKPLNFTSRELVILAYLLYICWTHKNCYLLWW
jgi:hypothetical protein